MCEPVTATTYAMMALSGGQAVLQNKSQVAAANARNRNKKRLYDNDVSRIIREHNQNLSLYYLRGVDAEHAWADATIEANRNANEQQVILNEGIAQALQATQDDYVKLAGDVSVARSLEKSGVSARRARVAARAKLGRAKAAREAQQDIALDKAAIVFAEIQRIKESKIREADRMIGLEPERAAPPPEPEWDKGPSMFQQLMNIGMAVGSAYLGGKKTPTGGDSFGEGLKTAEASGGTISGVNYADFSGGYSYSPSGAINQGHSFAPSGAFNQSWGTINPNASILRSQRLGNLASMQTSMPSMGMQAWGLHEPTRGMFGAGSASSYFNVGVGRQPWDLPITRAQTTWNNLAVTNPELFANPVQEITQQIQGAWRRSLSSSFALNIGRILK